MRVAILGRSELLWNTAQHLISEGHSIALVVTARSESHYAIKEADFKSLAEECGANYFCSQTLNSPEILTQLRASKSDIAITVNWPNLIGKEACDSFPNGILNGHAGDLPRYRGNACPNWAIINGEETVVMTIHQIDPEGIDTGDIIVNTTLPLSNDVYINDIYEWLNAITPKLFSDAIRGIEDETLQPVPQSSDPALSLRCYPRKPEDGRIDWTQSTRSIHALIRASSRPFSGSFCTLESGETVYIWSADLRPDEPPFLAVPGQILYREHGCVVVACSNGALKITDATLSHEEGSAEAMSTLVKSVRARLY